MSLLQMSVYGTLMILIIVMVRLVFFYRIPKRTFIILWGVVLLRLLIPVEVVASFSAFTLAGNALQHLGWTISDVRTEEDDAVRTRIRHVTDNGETIFYLPERTQAPAIYAEEMRLSWATLVWLIGMLMVAAYFIVSYVFCAREFRMALPLHNEFLAGWMKSHKIRRKLDIRQLDTIDSPVSYGVLRPVILLPKHFDWSNARAARYVLEHEFIHIERFDPALKLVMVAAVCVHWFNPAVWMMYVLLNRDIELSCDETVIRRFGVWARRNYALTLISMEEQKNRSVFFYNAFGKTDIKGRIRSIMKMRNMTTATVVVAAVLICTISVGFLTSSNRKEENENTEEVRLQEAMETLEEQKSIVEEHTEELVQTRQEMEGEGRELQQDADTFDSTEISIATEGQDIREVNLTIDKSQELEPQLEPDTHLMEQWRISTNPIPVTGRDITKIVARNGSTGEDTVIEDIDAVYEIIVGILEANVISQDEESRSGYGYLLILYAGEEEVQRFSISEGFIETGQVWYFVDSNRRILDVIE